MGGSRITEEVALVFLVQVVVDAAHLPETHDCATCAAKAWKPAMTWIIETI